MQGGAIAPAPGTAASKDTPVSLKLYGTEKGKKPKDCK